MILKGGKAGFIRTFLTIFAFLGLRTSVLSSRSLTRSAAQEDLKIFVDVGFGIDRMMEKRAQVVIRVFILFHMGCRDFGSSIESTGVQ